VPPPETARFQERLRYIICTSQLLSEKPTPSLYPPGGSLLTEDDYIDLFTRRRPLRYWIGTGGCVSVVALLVSWTLREGTQLKEARARNLAALALGLLIAVYLYAHTVPSLWTYVLLFCFAPVYEFWVSWCWVLGGLVLGSAVRG